MVRFNITTSPLSFFPVFEVTVHRIKKIIVFLATRAIDKQRFFYILNT